MTLEKFIEELRKAQYQIAINQRFSGDGSGMSEIHVVSSMGEPEIVITPNNQIYVS